ncbi:MAG TPA: hypothetical protein VMV18_10630 [bacterium]|nr:hypothetical protein [bacterium]
MALFSLAFALLALAACAPQKPDTSVPSIDVTFVSQVGGSIDASGTITDADGPGNILDVKWKTTAGAHGGACSYDPGSGNFDCSFTLPAGNWGVIYTVTDKAGWTGTASDNYSV